MRLKIRPVDWTWSGSTTGLKPTSLISSHSRGKIASAVDPELISSTGLFRGWGVVVGVEEPPRVRDAAPLSLASPAPLALLGAADHLCRQIAAAVRGQDAVGRRQALDLAEDCPLQLCFSVVASMITHGFEEHAVLKSLTARTGAMSPCWPLK
jgi:hypothetical protein